LTLIPAAAWADVLSDNANFNIPAQSVRTALIEFSKQADVQVMGSSSSFGNLRSTEVKGKLRARDALSQLLQNTGLKYEALRHAVVVKSIVTAKVKAPPVGVDVQSPTLELPEGPTSAVKALPSRDLRTDANQLLPLGSMVVTGSHIRGSDVVGSQLVVMDRQSIARTGYSTVQDLVRALPQVFGGGASEDSIVGTEATANTARSTGLNLRGLGAGSTLVLINGHRLAQSGSQSSFVDVSTIPLSAVSRVEILTDGASAIYGSDAVGGVINFIMRDDYQGAETQARYGSVTAGPMQETNFSQLFGTRWPTGHATFSYEYLHRDALRAKDRKQTANSDLRPLGGTDFSPPQSSPGNIVIGGTSYAIPHRQNGAGLSPSDLIAGTVNLQNLAEGRDQTGASRRHSAFVSLAQSLGDAVTLSGNALYSIRDVKARNSGVPTSFSVPAANPFRVLPAGVTKADDYQVQYNFVDDLGPRTLDVRVRTLNSSIGATAKLPRHWELSAAATYATEDIGQSQNNNINIAALSAALADSNPATAFNPFGGATNPATLASIRRTTLFRSDSTVTGANLVANGGLFALPGGYLRLAVGADYREQFFQTRRRGTASNLITPSPEYRRDAEADFAELLVPIVSRANRVPGIEDLQFSLAARYDDYDDFGATLNPRFGMDWSPVRGVAIHGNWGESFKAPNLPDMDESRNTSYITMIPDPQAAAGQSAVLFWQGGNADLKPETARTWTVGIRWAPDLSFAPTLDLSLFDIRFKDRIQSAPTTNSFLTDYVRYTGIVTRNPGQAQRADACRRGEFIFNGSPFPGDCLSAPIAAIVDARSNNTATSIARGLDLSGSMDVASRWGRFEVTSNIEYLLSFAQEQTPTAAPVSLLDRAGNPLRFKMRNGISWTRRGLGAAAFVNYAGGYRDSVTTPNHSVGSWTTFDLQLSYEPDANESWLAGCAVALNVQNLFDRPPPFVNDTTGVGYDRENADLLNRFISLRLLKDW
jgi:outer membrane receptor protein involved in Fe transport